MRPTRAGTVSENTSALSATPHAVKAHDPAVHVFMPLPTRWSEVRQVGADIPTRAVRCPAHARHREGAAIGARVPGAVNQVIP